ncbi:plasma kallikrein-like [Symphorus nematophorus]
MGTNLSLVGLLCLCGLSLSLACRRELLKDIDFPGADIVQIFAADAEHCQILCTQHLTCRFFSFLRADWKEDNRNFRCYLKGNPSGRPKVHKQWAGHTSGFSLKTCHPDPQPCLSQVYHNTDFFGADYRQLFTEDYGECQRACTHDPGCQFFTFLTQDFKPEQYSYKCHLKFSWPVPKIPHVTRDGTKVSGFSRYLRVTQNFGPACEGKIFPNTNVPGNDIEVLPAACPEHCQALCSAHPSCTYFSYNRHDFKCYLKNKVHDMAKKSDKVTTSGLPARFCEPNNDWIMRTYEGVDFPDAHFLRNFETTSAKLCQEACNEDPNCQYYTYCTEKDRNPALRRKCFLRRVITAAAPPKVTKLAHAVSGFSLKNCYYKAIV